MMMKLNTGRSCTIAVFAAMGLFAGCANGGSGTSDRSGDDTGGVVASPGAVASASLRSRALSVLELGAVADHPQLRANAIEAMHAAPELLPPYVRNGLTDENRGVRFVAAMTVGRLRMKDLAGLIDPLLIDDSESVRAAAMYALHECGRDVDLAPLGAMLASQDPEVRGNVAMIFGLLGNRSAAPMLEQAIGRWSEMTNPARAKVVDMQLAEALFYLGDTEQVQTIRATLFLPGEQQEAAALACLMLGRMRDQGGVGGLERMLTASGEEQRPAEVRMAAMMALSMLGARITPQDVAQYATSQAPELRQQAAITLGKIGGAGSLALLAPMLDDSDGLVAVAAAGAVAEIERGR
ncbi:MAG: HEAT repeat domain-containing protein [Phycisphaerales bacterium]